VTTANPGNPFTQQRSFVEGAAVAVCPDIAVVTVSGPDRLTWLHSLITQDVLTLAPHETTESLILDPNGRIEHAFLMSDDGETTWLATDSDRAAGLAGWLESMKFRMDVVVDVAGGGIVVAAHTPDALPAGATIIWRDPWPNVSPGSAAYSTGDHPGVGWSLAYGRYPEGGLDIAALSTVDPGVLGALTIAAGRPTLADIDQASLPHEYDWLRTAVHLNKGCYRGQETVAKVHNLGHPPRRLALLHLDGSGSVLPGAGDEVLLDGAVVGHVTRTAWHFELGPIALARLKRSADPEADLVVRSGEAAVAASQQVLVSPDAGRARPRPALPRLTAAATD